MERYTTIDDVNAFIEQLKANSRLNNRNISILTWQSPLDNHYPSPRNYGSGWAVQFTNDHVENGIVLWHDDYFGKKYHTNSGKIAFFVCNGETVKPYYLASWNVSGSFFILHPFPIFVNFGPRKTYQLHIKTDSVV